MRILSANKRWIVGPDISGCVYFYYTGAKGFPWDDSTRREDEFATFIKQGANGVITNRPDLLQKSMPKGFEYKEISRVGAFRFYSVGKN
jgi:hypothetical protein